MHDGLDRRSRRGPSRPSSWVLGAAATALLTMAVVGCDSSSQGLHADAGASTTVAAVAPVTVDPAAGPVGQLFTLSAAGLAPTTTIEFEITFPGEDKAFPGGPMPVAADGTAATHYRATTANPAGDYTVQVTASAGVLAVGHFTLTNGAPITTPTSKVASSHTSTTRRGTTGASTSTTKPKSSSSTTPGSTTPTTAKATTTTAPKSTVVPTTG